MTKARDSVSLERGDLVWIDFEPRAGHEQAGHRPALVLSPRRYNDVVGLALFCPITSRAKGYPFEVPLPGGLPITGVVLADQIKNLDWRARGATPAGRAPSQTVKEVLDRLAVLLE